MHITLRKYATDNTLKADSEEKELPNNIFNKTKKKEPIFNSKKIK